jgi:hypothetical protein
MNNMAAEERLQPSCLFLEVRLQILTQSKLHPDAAKVGRCDRSTLLIQHYCIVLLNSIDLDKYGDRSALARRHVSNR